MTDVQQLHDVHGKARLKRCADLVIALILLTIFAPLLLFISMAFKLEGPGPVFVRHACLNRRGSFEKLKFRTTVYDPDDAKPGWPENLTRFGEFLEYTRLDTLPEILNVLRGDMSLIDRELTPGA